MDYNECMNIKHFNSYICISEIKSINNCNTFKVGFEKENLDG